MLFSKNERRARARCGLSPAPAELPELIALLEVLTTAAVPLVQLAGRLGWSRRRLATRIEGLRQRGLRIVTADGLTVRVLLADADKPIELMRTLAPKRLA